MAAEIAAAYEDMELTSIYPVDYDGVYYFDGFQLETFHGEHKPQRFTFGRTMEEGDVISGDPRLTRLHALGGFYNMNYVLALDNGFRAAFVGGTDDGMKERLRSIRPNLAFRNKLANDMDVEKVAGEWLSFMRESFSQIVVPMHFEVWENTQPGFSRQTFDRANELAEEEGIPPESSRWSGRSGMRSPCAPSRRRRRSAGIPGQKIYFRTEPMRLPVFQQKTGSLIMQYARQAAAMPAWADQLPGNGQRTALR